MIDFHSHILPEMDDGSRSAGESVRMLKSLASQGVTKVIATPHFYANDESVREFLIRRQISYQKLSIGLSAGMPEILLGAEVKYYGGIGHLKELDYLCIQNSRLLLLEMTSNRWTEYTLREIAELSSGRNIIPVLAHVERYLGFQHPETIRRLVDSGVMMQVNASFFDGIFHGVRALNMLRKNRIHFIGTDCHNMTDRPPDLLNAVNTIRKKFGNDFADSFTNYANNFIR